MRLPAPLSRRKPDAHKYHFGHVLVLAGSPTMLGAAALCALSAMRSGAGLVTVGIPQSLNLILQKKISSVAMTLPLKETTEKTLSVSAYPKIKERSTSFDAIALGPGLSRNKSTQRLILKTIESTGKPLVIDADGLNAVSMNLKVLKKNKGIKVLTPHAGEMARLGNFSKSYIEQNRKKAALNFAKEYGCVLLLKGHRTIVASPAGQIYVNPTGNSGMATAGSGDVLTGMIAAFLAQGLSGFEAAAYGAYLHGKAGDLAAKEKTKIAMIAADIIDNIPRALRQNRAKS